MRSARSTWRLARAALLLALAGPLFCREADAQSAPSSTGPPSSATFPAGSRPIAAGIPSRHTGRPLVWSPTFRRVDTAELVLTGASAGVAVTMGILPPLNTGWSRPLPLDDAARDGLRLHTYQARLDARDASDVGLALLTTFPILVDSLIVAYWYRGSEDVARQMALIDAETLAISAALQGSVTFLTGRERPYVQTCGQGTPAATIDCNTSSEHRSFFSGHSALSFTSAALICAHHENLELFESSADHVTCASAFVAAGATATLRVVGDAHYLSDVVTGAAIGTLVGLGVPNLHHYRRQSTADDTGFRMHVLPTASGVQLVGVF